jgi:hypothetical protein
VFFFKKLESKAFLTETGVAKKLCVVVFSVVCVVFCVFIFISYFFYFFFFFLFLLLIFRYKTLLRAMHTQQRETIKNE